MHICFFKYWVSFSAEKQCGKLDNHLTLEEIGVYDSIMIIFFGMDMNRFIVVQEC